MKTDNTINFKVLEMLKAILGLAEKPAELSEYITSQVRELIGCKMVAMVIHKESNLNQQYKVICICPEKEKNSLANDQIEQIAKFSHEIHTPSIIYHKEKGAVLEQAFFGMGGNCSILVPIEYAQQRIGLLLLVDISDEDNLQPVLDSLDALSGVLALELRNSTNVQNLESIVEARTKELSESEKRFRSIVEQATDAMFIADYEGNIIDVNLQAVNSLGYSREELVQMKITDFDAVFVVQDKLLELSQAIQANGSFKFESIQQRKDGSKFPVEISSSLIELNGRSHIIGFARDISEQIESKRIREEELLLLKTIIDHLPSSIFVLDNQYRKTVYNKAHLNRIIGTVQLSEELVKEELIGKTNRDVYPKQLADNYFEEDRQVIEDGRLVLERENFQIDRFGDPIWETISKIPMRDKNDSIIGLVGIAHNITERKLIESRLKASEEKFRLLSNSAHDGIIMINDQNELTYWNPAIENIFGYPGEELVKIDINKLIKSSGSKPQEHLPINLLPDSMSIKITGSQFEVEVEKRDGSVVQLEISLAPLMVAEKWGAVGILRDISERKMVEKDLIYAKERAEESDRLKSAFLATMSHELRTPLNAIIGFSSLIEDDMEKAEILDMVKIINESGNHLLSIIDSVFNLALLQAGAAKINIEEIPLNGFFGGLRPYITTKLKKEKKEHLKLIENINTNLNGFTIKTDKTRLTQLMINLLDNAIKYTLDGFIEYGYTIENSSLMFYVKDSGIGIPANKKAIIFERFTQVEDTLTRIHGGVGLGLSICKEIASLLGGTLWLESELKLGSTFYFKMEESTILNHH